MQTLEIVSLAVGIIGGAIGALSIWLSLKLYMMSSQLNTAMVKMISDLGASSRGIEITTRDYTQRLVEGLISIATENMKNSVIAAEEDAKERIRSTIRGAVQPLQAQPDAIRKLQADLLGEVEAAFASALGTAERVRRLTAPGEPPPQLGALTPSSAPQRRVAPSATQRLTMPAPPLAPTDPNYDWGPFIRLVAHLENNTKFISVKWLREKKLAREPGMVEALQVAIDNSLLSTYRVPNPERPEFPVLACKLNGSHPIVAQIIGR